MKPNRNTEATLVDLLERLLDKGLMLNADLIIHVAGIPLLGVNLRACIAGMETMLRYGIWQDWDEAQRAVAAEELRRKRSAPLQLGEEVLLEMFASHWHEGSVYRSWRPGHLYVTDRRMLLFRKEPPEVLFQCAYDDIKDMVIESGRSMAGKEISYLDLVLNSGEMVRLHPADARAVEEAVQAVRSRC